MLRHLSVVVLALVSECCGRSLPQKPSASVKPTTKSSKAPQDPSQPLQPTPKSTPFDRPFGTETDASLMEPAEGGRQDAMEVSQFLSEVDTVLTSDQLVTTTHTSFEPSLSVASTVDPPRTTTTTTAAQLEPLATVNPHHTGGGGVSGVEIALLIGVMLLLVLVTPCIMGVALGERTEEQDPYHNRAREVPSSHILFAHV